MVFRTEGQALSFILLEAGRAVDDGEFRRLQATFDKVRVFETAPGLQIGGDAANFWASATMPGFDIFR
jgi:hypothetical protein